jgi:hypothetical protein
LELGWGRFWEKSFGRKFDIILLFCYGWEVKGRGKKLNLYYEWEKTEGISGNQSQEKEKMGPIFKQKLELVEMRQNELLEEVKKLQEKAIDFDVSVKFGRIRPAKETTLIRMEEYIKEEETQKEKGELENLNSEIEEQRKILDKVNGRETKKISNTVKRLGTLNEEKIDFLMKF